MALGSDGYVWQERGLLLILVFLLSMGVTRQVFGIIYKSDIGAFVYADDTNHNPDVSWCSLKRY